VDYAGTGGAACDPALAALLTGPLEDQVRTPPSRPRRWANFSLS
jgi:hypothetical protein